MPSHMLWNASLVVNSVDLSNRVRSLTITRNHEDLDATAMGSVARTHYAGLRDDSMEVTFFNDYAAANVEATISAILGSSTGQTIIAKPDTGAVAVTNPTYTMTGFALTHTPISGEVGEMNMTDVTFVPAQGSSIVKATA
jgi:hypothetical protein